jgi:structural maintenance of chromosome 3 (chondroitin sulfate proteoglycan 6)
VVKQVFGGTMICKNMNVAEIVVKQHKTNAVTLDGDVWQARGVMTGGFNDKTRQSRMDVERRLYNEKQRSQQLQEQRKQIIENLEGVKTELFKVFKK